MNRRKKTKERYIAAGIAIGTAALLLVMSSARAGLFATLQDEKDAVPEGVGSADRLESGTAYVWHHEDAQIEDDLSGDCGQDVFFPCIMGSYNFKNKETQEELDYQRNIWIGPDEDNCIPTLTAGDCLVYVSDEAVPDGIVFERFADYGYSVGISGLAADKSGHYYFPFADAEDDEYRYYIDTDSDASQLASLDPVTRLYLDKAGDEYVREDTVSDGGTVTGLEKGETYVCQFYTGTYYQDFELTADIHSFASLERFTSFSYEFMHSSFIVIKIPEYFKSGYYLVNGAGLFRYVAAEDEEKYSGEAYDEAIDWNDPVVTYNSDGTVKYDPSDPDTAKEQEDSDPGLDEEVTEEMQEEEENSEDNVT